MTKARRLVSIARLRCAYDATSGLSGLFNIWDIYFVIVFVISFVTLSDRELISGFGFWLMMGTNHGYPSSYYIFFYRPLILVNIKPWHFNFEIGQYDIKERNNPCICY